LLAEAAADFADGFRVEAVFGQCQGGGHPHGQDKWEWTTKYTKDTKGSVRIRADAQFKKRTAPPLPFRVVRVFRGCRIPASSFRRFPQNRPARRGRQRWNDLYNQIAKERNHPPPPRQASSAPPADQRQFYPPALYVSICLVLGFFALGAGSCPNSLSSWQMRIPPGPYVALLGLSDSCGLLASACIDALFDCSESHQAG
jgi:hypothetical protein